MTTKTREDFDTFLGRINNAVFGNGLGGLVAFEQRIWRSKRLKECVECGDPGTVQQESILVKSVSHYWMCNDCDEYWRNKS